MYKKISSFIFFTVFFSLMLSFSLPIASPGQFLEEFDGEPASEWVTFTGDGQAVSSFEWHDGHARFIVDATDDRQNVWWAIMRTHITGILDLDKLSEPGQELRMEARVRSSHAPRRLNMQLRTPDMEDNYAHLMEFDIPEAGNWHTISLTTGQLEARTGDEISAHIALMDWGPFVYELDVDYVKVDLVDVSEAGPDQGEQVPYPPPAREPEEFAVSVSALEAGMIDAHYPDVNFSGWVAGEDPVLTTDNSKIILLRWNLSPYAGMKAPDFGMLELTPYSFYQTTGTDEIEFDQIRLVEILGGDPDWTVNEITYNSFRDTEPIESALNTQMIIDIDIPDQKDSSRYIHIPRPVIQRMLDGRTKGIALYPLGALHVSFYPGDSPDDPRRPKLYFNVEE